LEVPVRAAMWILFVTGYAGLVLTSALGLGWIPSAHRVADHWTAAIWSVLLLLGAHTTILFYFLATGKQLRVLMQESGRPVNHAYLADLRRYKARVFPVLMLATGLTIATFVIGAGVLVGTLPRQVHLALAIATLAANAVAGARELVSIRRNSLLINKIEREFLT
jgi:hypothetical protein